LRFVRKIAVMGVVALPDVAIGIIIVHLIGKAFGHDIPVYFYPIGAFLSMFPDIDYPYHLWQVRRQKRKFYETHRLVPHYPIIIIPICLILGVLSVFWPTFFYWTVVVALCILGHYIHDSIGAKIRWLAPWGRKYYGLEGIHVVSWSEEEWRAWVRTLKENLREGSMGLQFSTKELITGIILFVAATLIVYLW